MLTLAAGPNGVHAVGSVREVDDAEGKALVAGGYASGRLVLETLRLEQSNYFGGGLTINGGTLVFLGTNAANTVNAPNTVIGDAALGLVPASFDADNIVINNSTLQIVNNATVNTVINSNRGILLGAGNANPGTIDVNNGTLFYGGVIADGGTGNRFQKAGAGALVLFGTNTYSGGTRITAGTLAVAGDYSLGAVPSAFEADNLVITNGTLRFLTNTTVSANRGMYIGFTNNGAVVWNATLSVDPGSTVTYNGIISNHVGNLAAADADPTRVARLIKDGAGVLELGGANKYNGLTAVRGGTLSISSDGNLGLAPGAATPGHLQVSNATLARF